MESAFRKTMALIELPRAEAWLRAAAPAITARLSQPG
jgi:hypothetical protein